jgi:hypothetical protein
MATQSIARIRLSVLTLFIAAAAALGAQDAGQAGSQSPYQGVSHPPSDDVITTSTIPEAKPPAGKPLDAQPAPPATAPASSMQYVAPVQATPESAPMQSALPASDYPMPAAEDGTDDGIVHVGGPTGYAASTAARRNWTNDPDSDIVHPQPLRAGELQEGTIIRVKLLDRLSTAETEQGEPFHTRVASDVLQGGQVVIPAGAEIDGKVVEVSSGRPGGHGTMRLNPESVTLPNGSHFRLHAEVESAPGSNTHVVGEGTIRPDNRFKRDGIEYAGAVGAGAATGAIVAGPVGALTGSLIGAGAITVHLMVDHPQATLDSGTTLMFMLTDPLYLAPETVSGN